MRRHRTIRRRGGVYVLVLIAVLIAAVTVGAGLDLVRVKHAETEQIRDYDQACLNALSIIERGLETVRTQAGWRLTQPNGDWLVDAAMPGGGAASLSVTGVGGSLSSDAWQPIALTGIGTHGRARAIYRVHVGLQASAVASPGGVLGGATPLGYWPLKGADASWGDDIVGGNTASKDDGGSKVLRPGMVPALGLATAPWLQGGATLRMTKDIDYAATQTVALWFWAADVTTQQGIAGRDGAGFGAGEWSFAIQNGRLVGSFESAGAVANLESPVEAARWNHAVLVAETGQVTMYLNGVAVGSAGMLASRFWDSGTDGRDLYVGADYSTGVASDPFTGAVCELVLLGEALSATQVRSLFDSYPEPARYEIIADTWAREVR